MLKLYSSRHTQLHSFVSYYAMRDTLALLFAESYYFVRSQAENLKLFKAELSSTKSQLLENQKWVISLQEQVIREKEMKLEGVKTAQ